MYVCTYVFVYVLKVNIFELFRFSFLALIYTYIYIDWKYLGLADYPDVVKHPMDLGTVMKKIENEQYSSSEVEVTLDMLLMNAYLIYCMYYMFNFLNSIFPSKDIALDVRLVWSNCKLYNRDGSEVKTALYIHTYIQT